VQISAQPLFPVVDEETRHLIGVFSKSDLIDTPRAKLVLVDHNEFAQAVAGADEAEIIEVIDHHRLSGNLRTKEPIRFLNEPVGSTSTIVGIMYRMRGAAPDKGTAICLCAGIISDTLHLTSPTTTSTDKEILAWLASIGGIDSAQFVKDFFAAGSMLRENTPDRALESDRKVFEENGWHISISQIEELGLDEFWKREKDLQAALQALLTKHSLHFACLMVTDITRHHSVLLVAGDQRVIDSIDYPEAKEHIYDMPGVVSRKKQLFPYMSHVVTKLAAP
jgi:manganese-dependent inorganic pyrophosphatase